MKQNCANLYLLSSIACQLAECMEEKQLETLALDLTALGAMLESAAAHRAFCMPKEIIPQTECTDTSAGI